MKALLIQFGIDQALTYEALKSVYPMDRKVILDIVYYLRGVTKDHRNFVELEDQKVVNTFHHCLPVFLTMYKNFKAGRDIYYDLDKLQIEGRTHNFSFMNKVRKHVEENLKEIYFDQYAFIGIYNIERASLLMLVGLFWLRLNQPDKKIICGGNWFDVNENVTKMLLEVGLIDLVIYGDGEILPDVVDETGEVRYYLENIDNIPNPTLQVIPWLALHKLPNPYALFFYATKGCPNNCSFCMQGMDCYRRVSSFSLVADKINEAIDRTGNNLLFCADNIWFGDMIRESHEEFAKRDMLGNLRFEHVNIHPQTCTDKNVRLMKELGMHPFLGIESFNTRILGLMNKRVTKEENLEAVRKLEANEIPYTMGRIFQFPGETIEEFHESLREYTKIFTRNPNSRFLGTYTLCPKTTVYENPERYGIEMVYFDQAVEDIVPELAKYVKMIPRTYRDLSDPNDEKFNKCANIIRIINEKIGVIFPL